MTNYTEHDLIIPSLKIIESYNDGIDTQKLIENLRKDLKPDGEDALILINRSDDKFSQKVRNLKSHKSLEKSDWVKFINNKYYITQNGIQYLKKKSNYLNLENKEIIFNFIPLKYFNFNERINSFLKLEKYNFVYDLNIATEYGENIDKLKNYRNLGLKSIDDIKKFYLEYEKYIDKNKNEINYKKFIFLYKKNINKIDKFVIEKIENEYDLGQNNVLNLVTFTNFLKKKFSKNYKSYKTISLIFNERILNNATLQSVGTKLNITRERVRQIEEEIIDKLKENLTIEKKLFKIDRLIKEIHLESAEDFYKRLISKKIIDETLSFINLFQILEIFNFKQQKKFKKINKKYYAFETISYETELKKNIKNLIKKKSKENGIINLNILHKSLSSQNFNITKKNLLELIDDKIIQNSLLIFDNFLLTNVFKKTNKSNNILVGVIKSTLSVTSKIDLEELILCIRQNRRMKNYSPEPRVLIKICKFLNYELQKNFIINKDYSPNNHQLTGVRKNLFKMFLDNERIMTYEEILENHEQYNLNLNSVNVMLYENLFIMPKKGIYVLAGTNTDIDILDRLDRKRQKDLKKLSDDSNWKYNEALNIVFTCNKASLQKGKIYMPNNFATELPEGQYIINTLNNNISILKVYASQLWFDGPSKLYFKKNMKKNVQLEFDTINKTIIVNTND